MKEAAAPAADESATRGVSPPGATPTSPSTVTSTRTPTRIDYSYYPPGAGLNTQNSLRTASSLGLDTDLPARVVHADAVIKIPRAPEDVVVLLLEEVAAARAAAAGLGRRRRGEVVGVLVEGARPLANSTS